MSSLTSSIGTSSSATAVAAAGAERGNSARWIGRLVIYGLLVIFAILYLMPLFVMLTTSFKTMDEI
ncbi:glucose/mannose transport system permease protein, partial [Rhizobium aethiopicum]|nr:glucose/mannose transport system permease protein [Rhizobium aethiopicum]